MTLFINIYQDAYIKRTLHLNFVEQKRLVVGGGNISVFTCLLSKHAALNPPQIPLIENLKTSGLSIYTITSSLRSHAYRHIFYFAPLSVSCKHVQILKKPKRCRINVTLTLDLYYSYLKSEFRPWFL